MEFKPEKYGAWTIRIRKERVGGSATPFHYEYKIMLHGEDISRGWVSVPYGANKEVTLSYAIQAIESNYKHTTMLSEHGGVLHERYDQFRGFHWG